MAVVVLWGLWALRDPAWLAGAEGGIVAMGPAGQAPSYRRLAPHAWFFVPASAAAVTIPLTAVFTPEESQPIRVRVSANDRLVAEHEFTSAGAAVLVAPLQQVPKAGRRHVRIEILVSRAWTDGLTGLQIGDIGTLPGP